MAALEEGEELSPEQIDALLERAERRLKEAQQLASAVSNSKIPSLPKLQHDNISTSYIKSEHGVVRTEPRSVVSETQRRLAEQTRKFTDPVMVKQQRKQKGKHLTLLPFALMRLNYMLDATLVPFWFPVRTHESFLLYHSYSELYHFLQSSIARCSRIPLTRTNSKNTLRMV